MKKLPKKYIYEYFNTRFSVRHIITMVEGGKKEI